MAYTYDRRASEEVAMEHPNENARQHYLRNHPDADPKNHTVKKKPNWFQKVKKDVGDYAKAVGEDYLGIPAKAANDPAWKA